MQRASIEQPYNLIQAKHPQPAIGLLMIDTEQNSG
jgi:hypothetical protein